MSTDSTRRDQIVSSLQDKAYRDAFVEQEIATNIPFQIRALRSRHGWTQRELGDRVEMKQETISLLENPNYARVTIRTLLRLASAFDVALLVRFVPFSELVDWTIRSSEDLAPLSYKEDFDQVAQPLLFQPHIAWPEGLDALLRTMTSQTELPRTQGLFNLTDFMPVQPATSAPQTRGLALEALGVPA